MRRARTELGEYRRRAIERNTPRRPAVAPLANRTQLTRHETLTLLPQFIRLIRRFRLEDAYFAQVIDINAVLRQRVGHFLEPAGTRSRDAASPGDSDWSRARLRRASRHSLGHFRAFTVDDPVCRVALSLACRQLHDEPDERATRMKRNTEIRR